MIYYKHSNHLFPLFRPTKLLIKPPLNKYPNHKLTKTWYYSKIESGPWPVIVILSQKIVYSINIKNKPSPRISRIKVPFDQLQKWLISLYKILIQRTNFSLFQKKYINKPRYICRTLKIREFRETSNIKHAPIKH